MSERSYSLEPASSAVRLLHITDHHLFSNQDDTLLGVNTHDSFNAVLTEIQQSPFRYDVVLATGDLIQDHNEKAYHDFATMVATLEKPVFWLEGNHDSQPEIQQYLAQYAHIHAHKQILLGEKWQLLLLNSQVVGKAYGHLAQAQLDWLASKLAEQPQRYTLVALHHNILPTNSAWLDQHSLQNSDALAQVLASSTQVKAIMHGHIHQEVDSHWCGYRVLSTPSTCIQFKPNCDEFTLDLLPQGWREITLHADGRIETCCKRLNSQAFLPDLSATGY